MHSDVVPRRRLQFWNCRNFWLLLSMSSHIFNPSAFHFTHFTHYLHNLISVQSTGRTRSSSLVTLARPPVSSSFQITNRSFTHASLYLWNQLPSSFRQPHSVHCPPASPHPAHITSSQSPPSLSSPITASTLMQSSYVDASTRIAVTTSFLQKTED